MFSEIEGRVKKKHQAPGTPIYTGDKKDIPPRFSLLTRTDNGFQEIEASKFEDALPFLGADQTSWLNVVGLNDAMLIQQIGQQFGLHPLTIEDILNVTQRPKIEPFENYLLVILKLLVWRPKSQSFTVKQMSLVIGKNFVLSFLESDYPVFQQLKTKFKQNNYQIMQKQRADYLAYRMIDSVVDDYFVVLEAIGDQIEDVETRIVTSAVPVNSKMIYRLKRQMLLLRKTIWPAREAISHLMHVEETKFISKMTRLYFRDVYDHIAQAIDSIDTFRDILASLLDVYLSSITNRMNEIMKMLTIISTIFIPITSIASIYGMNFNYMPGITWHNGFYAIMGIMLVSTIFMLIYFYKKDWL